MRLNAERRGEAQDHGERRVPTAELEFPHVVRADPNSGGNVLLRSPGVLPHSSDDLPEALVEGEVLFHERSVGDRAPASEQL